MEPQYKDLRFKTEEEFKTWLDKTATHKITFKDEGQDFLTWYLDDRGEVLHSELQSSIWCGKMVDLHHAKEGAHLPLQDGRKICHIIEKIEILNL